MEKKETWQPIETVDKNNSMSIDLWIGGKWNCRIADCRWVEGAWSNYQLDDSGGYGEMEMMPICDAMSPFITHWRDYPSPPAQSTRDRDNA